MKKDAYEDLVKEISKKLSEKILQEEGDLTGRIKTIDADIALIVREVGLRTSKLVIEFGLQRSATASMGPCKAGENQRRPC